MRILFITLTAIGLATAGIDAQTAAFDRGQTVRIRPASSFPDPEPILVLRVVAIPGDRIRAEDSRLYVNDVRVAGFSPEFMARVARSTAPTTVPAGQYFVMGEQRVNQDIKEYAGLLPAERLERVR